MLCCRKLSGGFGRCGISTSAGRSGSCSGRGRSSRFASSSISASPSPMSWRPAPAPASATASATSSPRAARRAMAFWGGIVGFGLVSLALYWMREYILYVVKAGHIAVMVHLIDGRDVPGGQGQIAYARQVVTERFAEANILFVMDQLVKGAIGAITGLIGGIAAFLPIPGLQRHRQLHQHGDPPVAHLCRRDHPRLQHPPRQPATRSRPPGKAWCSTPRTARPWSRTPSGCR